MDGSTASLRLVKLLLPAAAAMLVVAPSASADALTAHDKATVAHLIYARSDCLDCGMAPDISNGKWRFASDFGTKNAVGVAYLVVRYPTLNRTRTYQWLLSFDAFTGRWRIIEQARGGTFQCTTAVLVNPNYGSPTNSRCFIG